jgi:hypothetical protein
LAEEPFAAYNEPRQEKRLMFARLTTLAMITTLPKSAQCALLTFPGRRVDAGVMDGFAAEPSTG